MDGWMDGKWYEIVCIMKTSLRVHYIYRSRAKNAVWLWPITFVVEKEASLCGAGLGSDKVDVGNAWLDFDDLLAGRTALAEVRRRGLRRGDLEVVVAETRALHVELEVEQGDANCLPATHSHRPAAVGAPEVLLWVVGTRYVAVVVQHRTVRSRTTPCHLKPCKKSLLIISI